MHKLTAKIINGKKGVCFITENRFNSLTTKKQTTKFSSANFQELFNSGMSYLELKGQTV